MLYIKKRTTICLVCSLAILGGCKIEIRVPEEGEVSSQSHEYRCSAGESCIVDVSDVHFDQTFIAVPVRPNSFEKWKKQGRGLCGGTRSPCRLVTTWFPAYPSLLAFLDSEESFYLEPVFSVLNTWIQIGQNIDGEAAGDRSGTSLSLAPNGKRVAIGAPDNDGASTHVGHVRVYEWSGATWMQVGQDIDGEDASANFSTSISLAAGGKRLAVSAPRSSETGTYAGKVKVFHYNSEARLWYPLGQELFGTLAYDEFGSAVSFSSSGARLAVGAQSGGESYEGQVRVYRWAGSAWARLGQDINGNQPSGLFGATVVLSGDGSTLAVGAPSNDTYGDNAGVVRIYTWSGTEWLQRGDDIAGSELYGNFGAAVSLSGTGQMIAIGSIYSGTVKVFTWSAGTWEQRGDDITHSAASSHFGVSLSLSADGERLAIGDPWNGDNGYNAGQVQLYEWAEGSWVQIASNLNGQGQSENFGSAVSLSADGSRMASSAPNHRGYVGVYEPAHSDNPIPPVDPLKVYLLAPEHVEAIPQNNPATGCAYDPVAGYGLRVDFDWTDAEAPTGIAGYHLIARQRQATVPIVDTFVADSEYTWISCGSYVNNIYASSGVVWSVQAEDNSGNLGPLNDEGAFIFELCYLDNGEPCG